MEPGHSTRRVEASSETGIAGADAGVMAVLKAKDKMLVMSGV